MTTMTPTATTDRAAAIAALTDTSSPFAVAYWHEMDPTGNVRADALARFACGAEVTQ